MNKDYDAFWHELVRKYERVEKTSPSASDVEKIIRSTKAEPLLKGEIEAIVEAVSRGDDEFCQYEPDLSWLEGVETSSVEDGVLQMNRNKGDADADVKQRMEEFRKKALNEDADDEQDVESD